MKTNSEIESGQAAHDAVDRFMTPEELAKRLKMGARTLRRWKRAGLPRYRRGKIVRYLMAEVQAWMRDTTGGIENQLL